ncbi:MAG: hypothetical protein JSV80_15540 [Acidobacteriota bacterium]|nr:MAG: hypothetical protein JSV80_15540 [Acidobacteriota bacterium]
MIQRDRRTLFAIAATLTAALFGPFTVRADLEELPYELALRTDRVELELRDGRVDVIIDPLAESGLRVNDLLSGEETTGFVLIDEREEGLVIGQPHGGEKVAPRLLVEIVTNDDISVEIRGSGLNVVIDDRREEAPSSDGEHDEEAASRRHSRSSARGHEQFLIEVEKSDVVLRRVRGARLEGSDNSAHLEQTTGSVEMALADSSLFVDSHRGRLDLAIQDSDVQIDGAATRIEVRLTDSQLSIADGVGELEVDATNSDVFLERWQGNAHISGQMARVDLVECGAASDRFYLGGTRHELNVAGYAGALTVVLRDGAVNGQRLHGPANLTLDAGSINLEELHDAVGLRLREGVQARLEGARRKVDGTLEESRLDLRDVREVNLNMNRAELYAVEMSGKTRIKATDSDVEVDLRGNRTRSELIVESGTRARISMSEPCTVRLEGKLDDLEDQVLNSGCELAASDDKRRPTIRARRGGAPTVLNVRLDEDATLEVSASP